MNQSIKIPLSYALNQSANCDLSALMKIKLHREIALKKRGAKKYWELIHKIPLKENIYLDLSKDIPLIGRKSDLTEREQFEVETLLKGFIPWRKGPFQIYDTFIDSEWRSYFKWNRIRPYLGSLEGKKILDIGCNNGYYLLRMLGENPNLVIGLEPVYHFYFQALALLTFIQKPQVFVELFGVEQVGYFKEFFDIIFYMGIIYHHRDPLKQLQDIYQALKPGGKMVIETIGMNIKGEWSLSPKTSYARMKNVYFIPTPELLEVWLFKSKFKSIEQASLTPLTQDEQRFTSWHPAKSETPLPITDPLNPELTIEGYPAPWRFTYIATK